MEAPIISRSEVCATRSMAWRKSVISSAAFCASCTRQKMMASTLTGTVSLVSACSALKAVVWMRWSMTWATLSRIGKMKNRPGPRTAWKLPARRTTKRCQTLAIFRERATMAASRMKGAARAGCTSWPASAPVISRMTTKKRVIGFMAGAFVRRPLIGARAILARIAAPPRVAVNAVDYAAFISAPHLRRRSLRPFRRRRAPLSSRPRPWRANTGCGSAPPGGRWFAS